MLLVSFPNYLFPATVSGGGRENWIATRRVLSGIGRHLAAQARIRRAMLETAVPAGAPAHAVCCMRTLGRRHAFS